MDFPFTQSARATLVGLTAPVGWGMSVGLIRKISEQFGLAEGMTLLSLSCCLFLLCILGIPKIRLYPKKYLLFGLPMANICTLCFCISLHISDGGQQTVEVGMVNYLWPCLVVLFAVLFNGQKARWWIVPGTIVSFAGVMLVLGGDAGIDPAGIAGRFLHNPLSYILAFASAVSWAAYSNFTRAWSNGQNPMVLVFAIDTAVFSLLWASGFGGVPQASAMGWISVLLGAVALGLPYAAWSYGVTRGNIAVLAIASYFTPVLSCLFAALWIGADLDAGFFGGVALVVAGSLLCWSSTALCR